MLQLHVVLLHFRLLSLVWRIGLSHSFKHCHCHQMWQWQWIKCVCHIHDRYVPYVPTDVNGNVMKPAVKIIITGDQLTKQNADAALRSVENATPPQVPLPPPPQMPLPPLQPQLHPVVGHGASTTGSKRVPKIAKVCCETHPRNTSLNWTSHLNM